MDYDKIQKKKKQKKQFDADRGSLPESRIEQMEHEFELQFTYDSLALSGSSLTLEEVGTVLNEIEQREKQKKE